MADAQDVPGSSEAAPAAHPQVGSRYDQLTQQHHSLDQRLHDLATMAYLTDAQQQEELMLKKKKLAIKDQIAALLAGARS